MVLRRGTRRPGGGHETAQVRCSARGGVGVRGGADGDDEGSGLTGGALLSVDEPALRWAAATHAGCVRSVNQDSILAGPIVFAVADGMGGHAAGEVASALAITHVSRLEPGCSVDDVLGAVARANTDVIEQGHPGSPQAGMGTTLTGVAFVHRPEGRAVMVFNAGDSRTYRVRTEEMVQITTDHSLVAEMVRDGELEAEHAEHHPARHIVTRALGVAPVVEVDHWILPVVPGDAYLVCSDGLTNEVDVDELAAIVVAAASEQAAVDALIERALVAGARDNVSAVLVRVEGSIGAGDSGRGAVT